jgi:pyridoxamine 5'-phosphate oxidase
LAFVGAGEDKILTSTRKEQWGNLSDPVREQFYWQSPGIDFSGDSIVPAGGRDEEGVLLSPQDNFLLMFLLPHEVDYLRLGDNYRQVDQLKDGAWISTRVNP